MAVVSAVMAPYNKAQVVWRVLLAVTLLVDGSSFVRGGPLRNHADYTACFEDIPNCRDLYVPPLSLSLSLSLSLWACDDGYASVSKRMANVLWPFG